MYLGILGDVISQACNGGFFEGAQCSVSEYRRCRKFLLYFVTVEQHVWHLGLGIENFATRNELDHVMKDQMKVIALVYTAS